jgi:hypothetical protein
MLLKGMLRHHFSSSSALIVLVHHHLLLCLAGLESSVCSGCDPRPENNDSNGHMMPILALYSLTRLLRAMQVLLCTDFAPFALRGQGLAFGPCKWQEFRLFGFTNPFVMGVH